MPDRADPHATRSPAPRGVIPAADEARRRFAAARVRHLEELEGRLLALAVQASDDTAARWLEAAADTAWRDARAFDEEHRPVQPARHEGPASA